MIRMVLAAALAAGLSACDAGPCGLEPNKLDGSIGDLLDIQVDSVKVKQVPPTDVSIIYFHGNQTVAKVSVDVTGEQQGAAIPLRDPRQLVRLTSPPTQFPKDLDAGQITFTSPLSVGKKIQGCFAVRFIELDGTKRSLSGAFDAKLEAADAGSSQ